MFSIFMFFATFLRFIRNLRTSVPPGVAKGKGEIKRVVAQGGADQPWLPYERAESFKAVVPADGEKILLGWRKEGFGKHRFNPFPVVPHPGQDLLLAARRDLREAIGVTPTELIPMGNILIVIEHNGEARDEEMIRATGWTGDAFESPQTIPTYFPMSSCSYSLDDASSVSTKQSNLSSSSVHQVKLEGLRSFSPLQQRPSLRTRCAIAFRKLFRSSSEPETDVESPTWVLPLPKQGLVLPWHSMYPDDEFWYPLLAEGKKFVGRVDYSVAKDGEDVGQMRRWWFAVVDDE